MLTHDPTSEQGLQEIAGLDRKAAAINELAAHRARTLSMLWSHYTRSPEWRSLSPRTRSDYQAVRDWLGPAAERAIVSKIASPQIFALRDKAASEKGRRFGNYTLAVLRLVLEYGRVRGWLKENPAKGIKAIRRPKGLRHVNRAWTDAEVAAFFAEAPRQLVVPVALGLFACMRQGDALTVTWGAYNGQTLTWQARKNGEPQRANVTGVFRDILEAAKASREAAGLPPAEIAVNSYGQRWSGGGFRSSFFKLIAHLVAEGKIEPGCTFHGLRHTVASFARDQDFSESYVAAALGDRTVAMAAIYGRDSNRLAAAASILGKVQDRFGPLLEASTDVSRHMKGVAGERPK